MPDCGMCPRCGAQVDPVFSCASCLLAVANSRPEPPDLAGELFGSHVIGRLLGQGGMGVVYEALDTRLGRTVALKMLADDVGASDQLRREAELAASLEHEHIVPIYEADEHEGIAYFTMKRIDGGHLESPVSSARRAAEIALALSKAIEFAHRHGILHLDLKPANVLVDKSGKPFVTDFGLARRVGFEVGAAVMSRGTPMYMAPEVWMGEPGAASVAADIWGVGALLYEMLAGLPPFQASTKDELMKRVTTEPPLPLVRVPVDLVAVCFRCLEKDPARRYANAGELAADIARFLDGETVEARPRARWVYRTWRHPAVLFLAVLFTIAAIVAIVNRVELARTEQTVEDVANVTANSWARNLAVQLAEYAAIVELASRDTRVIETLSGRGLMHPSVVCDELCDEYPGTLPTWILLDMDGKMVGRAPVIGENTTERNFKDRDYFIGAESRERNGIPGAYISKIYQSEIDRDHKFAFSVVVHDETGRKLGLLVATLPTGSMLGAINLPNVKGKDVTFDVLAPRDSTSDGMPNGSERGDHPDEPEMVFLLRRDLDRGVEVPAEMHRANQSNGSRSAFTRVVPVPGTPFLVRVRVASDAFLGDLERRAERDVSQRNVLDRDPRL